MLNLDIIPASIGIVQAIIFSVLILSKRPLTSKDIILLAWFSTFSLHLGLIVLFEFGSTPIVLVLAKSLTLLHGPFFLMYTRSVFGQFNNHLFAHFITFVLFFMAGLLISDNDVAGQLEIILTATKVLTLIGYPIYVLFWTRKRVQTIKNKSATDFMLNMRWINSIASLMVIYSALGIVHVLAEVLFAMQFSAVLDLAIYALMITAIGFLGLKFGRLYTPEFHALADPSKPYKNSPLSSTQADEIRKKIDAYFDNTADFLNAEFNLTQLSEKLNAPKHHLSEVINHEMDTTFYDIVNGKRIEFAKRRILEKSDAHISLEGLGYECGFNTKSAFYLHFKNFTGKTPGQFKSEISPD